MCLIITGFKEGVDPDEESLVNIYHIGLRKY